MSDNFSNQDTVVFEDLGLLLLFTYTTLRDIPVGHYVDRIFPSFFLLSEKIPNVILEIRVSIKIKSVSILGSFTPRIENQ